MIRSLFTCLLICLLCSCSNIAQGPTYSSSTPLKIGETGLYIFTKDLGFHYSIGAPRLYVDNHFIGDVPSHGFLYKKLTPGQHQIDIYYRPWLINSEQTTVKFNLNLHEIKYFKVEYKKTALNHYQWAIQQTISTKAQIELQDLPSA